ncbi:glutamate synthase subunit beta [Geomicrobium sp. JCM 19038]|uniref:glutamate synthase subunit beta n=1 Tax=Geomicrobium sp. JCM 19038 TaxID=1460635 RepID=UPI00045F2E44|nr:glutamate synthase subunit beta [Geomicrobium sp. JCM 19038]GAK06711.1 glutamate synthase [Geomicrobium sp. JCM 19038]
MGKATGFMEIERQVPKKRDPRDRVQDWQDIHVTPPKSDIEQQASRCMDCGVPFCQAGTNVPGSDEIGCPVYNLIPEWNDLVYHGRWKDALERLHKTNNFPEFTGKVCPAPCEGSCTVAIDDDAVTIKSIEWQIVENGFKEGWIKAKPPRKRTGKRVAVIGSGPAGLAAAAQLNKVGHTVVVYEKEDRVGGLLTYGIPDVKLPYETVMRRVRILEEEGITFKTNVNIGETISWEQLNNDYSAVILCTGAQVPRGVSDVPGHDAKGVHFAMDFLTQNTKSLLDSKHEDGQYISAAGKNVIVIGGGDTGVDCITTSVRHGAKSIAQFDINKIKGETRNDGNPWPLFPLTFAKEDGHKEAEAVYGEDPRAYQWLTTRFVTDDDGVLVGLEAVQAETVFENGQKLRKPITGSEKVWDADLVLLAIGFTGPERELLEQMGVKTTNRGTVDAEYGQYNTSVPSVYAAGDNRRGQSLVVWAIHEGREAAREVDRYLMGSTILV